MAYKIVVFNWHFLLVANKRHENPREFVIRGWHCREVSGNP